MYRAIDTGLRTIDVRTLTEAAQSLGAGWITILGRLILPNVLVAVLSGAFLTFAIVIGEYVLAALLNRPAFGPYMVWMGSNRAYEPAALAVIAFAITWGCLGLIQLATRLAPHTRARSLMSFIQLNGLAKQFGPTKVVNDFSLSIPKGAFVSLLGPSGCGKTTVLRMLAGFETPTAGSIVIDGKDVTALKANQRQIGMVFQAYALFPNLTVAQNVAFGLQGGRQAAGRDRQARGRDAGADRPARPRRPLSLPALRRPAAARGAGARPRAPARACCCSTSRCRPSTPRSASACGARSAPSSANSASPPSS